jgi:pimeloyl-ACP methyl ester carboxylesterase
METIKVIDRMIKVGGHRLFVRDMGEGHPVIITENAMGSGISQRIQILPAISDITRIISYSRAGNGRSDMSTDNKRDCYIMARELSVLLDAVNAEPPYLLVGASFGGFVLRTFVHLYPEKTAGMVLIDPSHEDFIPDMKKVKCEKEWQEFLGVMDEMVAMGSEGFKYEWKYFFNTSDYVRGLPFPSHVPVVVISSNRFSHIEKNIMKLSKDDVESKSRLHAQWALENKNVTQMITSKSGHDIVNEEPELVINVIKNMINIIMKK